MVGYSLVMSPAPTLCKDNRSPTYPKDILVQQKMDGVRALWLPEGRLLIRAGNKWGSDCRNRRLVPWVREKLGNYANQARDLELCPGGEPNFVLSSAIVRSKDSDPLPGGSIYTLGLDQIPGLSPPLYRHGVGEGWVIPSAPAPGKRTWLRYKHPTYSYHQVLDTVPNKQRGWATASLVTAAGTIGSGLTDEIRNTPSSELLGKYFAVRSMAYLGGYKHLRQPVFLSWVNITQQDYTQTWEEDNIFVTTICLVADYVSHTFDRRDFPIHIILRAGSHVPFFIELFQLYQESKTLAEFRNNCLEAPGYFQVFGEQIKL